jgi:hypothetical protein
MQRRHAEPRSAAMPAALITLAAFLAPFLGACSGKAPPPPREEQPPPSGVLLDSAKRPLERAKGVDDTTRDHKREMDEQLDQAER